MQKTIRKNQIDAFLAKVVSAKCYSLDNGFSGATVEDIEYLRSHIQRLGKSRITFCEETGKGEISLHGNCWFDVQTAA